MAGGPNGRAPEESMRIRPVHVLSVLLVVTALSLAGTAAAQAQARIQGVVTDRAVEVTDSVPKITLQITSSIDQLQATVTDERIGFDVATRFTSGEEWEERGEMDLDQRTRLRLASTWAIQSSREIVNTLFHDCGSMAVFEENLFERRLRDIDTVAQQGQGRILHYETVGQVMLGVSPENIF